MNSLWESLTYYKEEDPRSRALAFDCVPGSPLKPFIPCLGEYECLSPGLLRFPGGGKKVIASSLNEYALGPQEEHLSLSIQRSETASSVGDIGSPSLLSYLSPWLGSGLV